MMNVIYNPQPIRTLGHESDLGRWTMWRRPPAPLLSPYVVDLQGYVEVSGRPIVRDEYPTGLVHMIIVLDHGFYLDATAGRPARPLDVTFVAGMHRISATVGSLGDALCMQVDFTPLGARRFLRIDNVELADQVVDLAEMLPELDRTMRGRLLEARSWEQRFQWLEGCLARRVLDAPEEDRRMAFAWQALYGSGGALPVGDLSERLNISRKHFIDLFSRHVGVTPKVYARIVRFSRALKMIQAEAAAGTVSLVDVAAASGYSDQAHFNRDFKAMTGITPTAVLQRLVPDGSGVMSKSAG